MAPSYDLLATISASAHNAGVPVDIFNHLIATESDYNTRAVGPPISFLGGVRAQGIAQFIPSSAARYGVNDPFDYRQALPAAAKLLRDAYDKNPAAGWMTAVGTYKGKSGNDNVKRQYADDIFSNTKHTVYDVPDATFAGISKNIVVSDGYIQDDWTTSLGQMEPFKSLGIFQQQKIASDGVTTTKVDAQTGEASRGSIVHAISNYGAMALGSILVLISAVRLSL